MPNSTRTWHPTSDELKVRMFINYKLFGIFVKKVAETIIKGMVTVTEVDYNGDYCFVTTSPEEKEA